MNMKTWMKRGLSLLLAVVMILSYLPSGILSIEAVTPDSGSKVVDANTMDNWKEFFNLQKLTTENAGKVWTDKTVLNEVPAELKGLHDLDHLLSQDQQATVDITMENAQDNFLVALSVMASNKTITGYSTMPTDTVFVLDLSSSMRSNDNDGDSAIDELVDATNDAMTQLLSLNNHNRVAVVLYAGNKDGDWNNKEATTEVLLPLDHYTAGTFDRNGVGQFLVSTARGSGRYTYQDERIDIASGVKNGNNQTVTVSGKDTATGTFTQDGLHEAMQVFLDADPVIPEGKIQAGTSRIPFLVLMTDGEPTMANPDYQNLGTSLMTISSGDYNDDRNVIAFMTQLTASWTKYKVSEHYGEKLRFYTLAYGTEAMEREEAMSVVNPAQTCAALERYWNDLADGSVHVWTHSTGSGKDKKTITSYAEASAAEYKALTDNKVYADKFYPANSDDDFSNAFDSIVQEIILQSRYTPTMVSGGQFDLEGYVSFVDHIGEHMEITDIKGMTIDEHFFSGAAFSHYITSGNAGTMENPSDVGNEFIRSVKTRLGIESTAEAQALVANAYNHGQISYTSATEFGNYIGWYSDANGNYLGFWYEGITAQVPDGATHINKSYGYLGEVDEANGLRADSDMMYTTVRVRECIVDNEDKGFKKGDITLAWAIPSALIPTLTYEVKLAGETYDSNVDNITAKGADAPIRLIYEVAVREDIHDYNINEMLENEVEHINSDGTYTFYSNDWLVKENDPKYEDATNTYAYFEPSRENEYYYYIVDSVICDANGNAVSAVSDGGTYYHEYYVYTAGKSTPDRRMLKISSEVLASAVQRNGNWIIPKGTQYRMLEGREVEKNPNATNTMPYVTWPVVQTGENAEYHNANVLGNNGRLTVTPATGIKLTKTLDEVKEGVTDKTFKFTVTGDTGSFTLVRPGKGTNGEDLRTTVSFGAEFTVEAGETVYVIGLTAGKAYTVTEMTNEHYAVQTIKEAGQSGDGVITAVDKAIVDVEFINAPKVNGNLVITKGVTAAPGHTAPTGTVFTMTVTLEGLANMSFDAKHSADDDTTVTTDAQGQFTVRLKSGETFEVFDLPADTVVTVAEQLENGAPYTVAYRSRNYSGDVADDDGVVTIHSDKTSTVVVSNTYKAASVEVDLNVQVSKTFKSKPAGEFVFDFVVEVWNAETRNWELITDKDGHSKRGSITFAADQSGDVTGNVTISDILHGITFTKPGEYAFQIREIPGNNAAVAYDQAIHTFTVIISDNAGKLEASVLTHNDTLQPDANKLWTVQPQFVNVYNSVPVYVDVKKTVDNNSNSPLIHLSGFRFELYHATVNGTTWTMDDLFLTETSDGIGEARFAWTLDANKLGDNYYILKEVVPANLPDGWSYDSKEYHITVNVSENTVAGEDQLVATVSIADAVDGKAVFTNTYDPADATVSLNTLVKKSLSGRTLAAGGFTFQIRKNNTTEVVATGTNDANGNVTFDPATLTFAQIGKYEYDIVEVAGAANNGITYDGTIYDLVVEVTDGGNGKLVANYYFEDATGTTVTFKNTYKANPVDVVLGGFKKLLNRTLLAAEFQFELKDSNGNVIQTVDNAGAAAGEKAPFQFEKLTFNAPGIYTYTISEKSGSLTGITYDNTVYTVKVTVTDDGNGKLVAVADKTAANVVFTNTYTPQNVGVVIAGTKRLEGNMQMEAGMFHFNLYDADGKYIETVANNADGSFAFTGLSFNQTGTYVYEVREQTGSMPGVEYDSTVYTVTISVTYNQNTGAFSATQTYTASGSSKNSLAFTNNYVTPATVTLGGHKTMDGNPAAGYTFELRNADGVLLGEATSKADGTFEFEPVTYRNVGSYLYYITEVKGDDSSVIYDSTIYHAHVEVTRTGNTLNATVTYGTPSANEAKEHHGSDHAEFANYSREGVKVHLEVSKVLENRALADKEFEFVLKNSAGVEVATAKNDLSGKVVFPALSFNEEGIYTYTITEKAGNEDYMKYDDHVVTATIVVTAPEDNGPFQYTVSYSGGTIFTNKPNNKPGSFSFTKVDEKGNPLAGAEFTLKHVSCNNCSEQIADIKTVSDANGVVTFTNVKTGHQYELEETKTPANYKTTAVRHVNDIYGEFFIDGVSVNTDIEIINVAADHTEVILKGIKLLLDGNVPVMPENGAFSFQLIGANGQVLQTQTNMAIADHTGAADMLSEFIFDAIPLTAVGTYTYTIVEVDLENIDVIHDTTVYEVQVVVSQKGNSLEVTGITYKANGKAAESVVFTNKMRTDAQANITATKVLTGKDLVGGDFTFCLKNAAGETIQTVTNDANGNIAFAPLTYSEIGKFTYTISEQAGNDPYTTYDSNIITVNVNVTAQGEAYVAEVTYTDAKGKNTNTFRNEFSDRGYAALELLKTNEEGLHLAGVQFTLTHACEQCDTSIAAITGISREDGKVILEHIPSGHSYILEETETPDGYIPAKARTVTVSFGEVRVNGELYIPGQPVQIINYPEGSVSIRGTKTLVGREMVEGEFKFELYEIKRTERTLIGTAVNDFYGYFGFESMNYSDEGTYVYEVVEVNTAKGGVTYDNTVYVVTVTVTEASTGKLSTSVSYQKGNVAVDAIVFENTYTAASVKTAIVARKVLENRLQGLEKNEFQFVLTSENGVVAEAGNDVNGDVKIELPFDKAGIYKFTLAEKPGAVAGVTYDNTVYYLVIEVTDPGDGQLVATTTYYTDDTYTVISNVTTPVFTNSYDAKAVTETITAEKVLKGRDLVNGEFRFLLKEENSSETIVATNDEKGNIQFSMTYNAPGTYRYVLFEQNNGLGGVTYDDNAYYIAVVVTDPGQGKLVAETTYYTDATYTIKRTDVETPVFANIYDAESIGVEITAKKVLEGRDLVDGEFEFVLKQVGNPLSALTTNDAEGNIRFNLYFSETGVYKYQLTEKNGGKGGVTYDETVYYFTVTVTDPGNGELEWTITYTDATYEKAVEVKEMVFTNEYDATGVDVLVEAKKTIRGRELVAGEFEFVLEQEGNPFSAVTTNDADGNVCFHLTFDKVGTYKYTLTEKAGKLGGVTYDDQVYYFTVTVTDPGTGELTCEITHFDANGKEIDVGIMAFVNEYKAEGTAIPVIARKVMDGRDLKKNEFEFVLTQVDGSETYTARNDENGNVIFDLSYEKAGTYKYTLTEKAGTASGVTYDDAVYNVTVTVTDSGNGKLVSQVDYTDAKGNEIAASGLVFTNTYSANAINVPVVAEKVLEGATLNANDFEFVLTDLATGKTIVRRNDKDGNVNFNLTFDQVGTYKYTLTEMAGNITGVTYDDTVYYFTVKVTDPGNGQLAYQIIYTDAQGNEVELDKMVFTNRYSDPDDICVPIVIHKTVLNKNNGCMGPGGFKFMLVDAQGVKVTTVTDALGGAMFKMSYSHEDLGKTFHYTVTEIDTGREDVKYSTAVYRISVTIALNEQTNELVPVIWVNGMPVAMIALEFVNVYEPELPPVPTEPAPTESEPTEPAPTESEPTKPAPTEPKPTEPKPTEPVPTESEPTEPTPTETEPTKPAPTETEPTEPKPTDPDVPDTSDNGGLFFWTTTMFLSVVAMAVLLLTGKSGKRGGKYARR